MRWGVVEGGHGFDGAMPVRLGAIAVAAIALAFGVGVVGGRATAPHGWTSYADTYARVAPTQFPGKPGADAPLIHRVSAYSKPALWDGVKAWFDGGKAVTGTIDAKAAAVHTFKAAVNGQLRRARLAFLQPADQGRLIDRVLAHFAVGRPLAAGDGHQS